MNWTLVTATSSAAFAERATELPETVALLAGAVNDTVGGPASTLLTLTATPADVVVFPAASRATAVSVWPALVALVESQVIP